MPGDRTDGIDDEPLEHDERFEDELLDEDDGPIDLTDVDPETWWPGIPWRPPVSLVILLVLLPLVSVLARDSVADRLAVEAPDQLWAIDAWTVIIAAALIAGAVLVAVVPLAARFARGHDDRILWVLDHGSRIGVILVAALVLLHTVLAAGLVLAVERLVLGLTLPGTTGVVVIAGLASATYLAGTGLGALRSGSTDAPALVLCRHDAPALFDTIHDLAYKLGVDPPSTVLSALEMDFWVGNGPFRTLDGIVDGLAVQVSIPQMALLSTTHMEAVLAHELAHIRHGDLDLTGRIVPMYDRLARSIEALETESRGIARVAARPGLRWLEFALGAIGTVIGERWRKTEAAADAAAVEIVGADAAAEALLVTELIAAYDDGWAAELGGLLKTGDGEPTQAFIQGVREASAEVTAEDVLLTSLENMSPTHPALLTRLRAIRRPDPVLRLPETSALDGLIADPRALVRRLVTALAPRDPRGERLELNAPRVTAGVVGWLIAGVAFGVIITYRLVTASGPTGDLLIIVGVVAVLWLLFPIVYPWLQREAIVDSVGIRLRPWWWRWLDADAERLAWSRVRWTDDIRLSVGIESLLTLTDGNATVRWWGGLWPKAERDRLYDAMRKRGVSLAFTSALGDTDPERHAVVWYVGDRLLVPEVKRLEDGRLMEMRPVKALGLGTLKLSFALIDRLQDPVEAAGPRDAGADIEHLAALVEMDVETFERDAQRMTIDGALDGWTIRIDGVDRDWTIDRKVDKSDLDDIVFDIFGIEKNVRAPRRQRPKDPY